MKKTIAILIFLCFYQLQAQEHAWVYFTDKPNAEAALEDPSSILTQRAIDRKNEYGVAIDFRDVPVNEAYITTLKQQAGINVKAKSKWMNCVHVIGNQNAIENLTAFAFVDHITYADKNLNARPTNTSQTTTVTNKYGVEEFFNYGQTSNQVSMINLLALHQSDFTGQGMWVAVLDSGFPNVNTLNAFQYLRNHNGILGGYDFVGRSDDFNNPNLHYHGMSVLSEMAGYVENEFVGTAPDASYFLFRTEDADSETPVEESYWVEAAERADSLGIDVINSSLGYNLYDDERYSYSPADMDGNTAFVTRGANIAVEKGILVVVAAGNSAENPNFPVISAPADGNVFTVGAVDPERNYANFSSIGPSADGRIKPDVVVQGQSNAFINTEDEIATGNGTSFASPTLAGAITCLWQYFPEQTNLEIMQLVRESSSLYENPTDELGYGIPNFQIASGLPLDTIHYKKPFFYYFPNPVEATLFISTSVGPLQCKVYDLLGKLIFAKNNISSEINLSALSKGIYIAKFENENFQKTVKLIKQ